MDGSTHPLAKRGGFSSASGFCSESAMADTFDPYHRWLGIGPEDQPPHHYRLLGLALFEADRDIIDSVAMRHIGFLQEITGGDHVPQAQRLLNELAAARRCLLDPRRKAAYDADLKAQLATAVPPPPIVLPGSADGSPQPPADWGAATTPGPPANSPHDALGFPSVEPAPASPAAVVRTDRRRIRRGARGGASPYRAPRASRWTLLAGGAAGMALMILAAFWSRPDDPDLAADPPPEANSAQLVDRQPRPGQSLPQPASSQLAAGSQPGATQPPARDMASGQGTGARRKQPDPQALAASVEDSGLPLRHFDSPADVPATPGRQASAEPLADSAATEVIDPASLPLPLQIDGLLLWLDADDAASVRRDAAGAVSRWHDKSPRGFEAETGQAGSGAQVQRIWAGRSGLHFAGGQSLSVPGTSAPLNVGDRYCIVFVARGSRGILLSKGSGDRPGSFALHGAAELQIGGADHSTEGDSGETAAVRAIVADENELRWFVDGAANRVCGGGKHAIQTAGVLRIGCVLTRGAADPQYFEGDLGELLIYDRPLDEGERGSLEKYLAAKWLSDSQPALPLPAESAPASDDASGESASSPETLAAPPPSPAVDVQQPADASDEGQEVDEAPGSSSSDEAAGRGDASRPDERPQPQQEPDGADAQDAEPRGAALFVNLGGDGYEDAEGNRWQRSEEFDGQGFGHENGQKCARGLQAYPDQLWAETAIRGLTAFRASLPNGRYEVTLCFCEQWTQDPDRRKFFVVLERGPRGAVTIPMHGPGISRPWPSPPIPIRVMDGQLDIEFSPLDSRSLAVLNAVVIRPAGRR